MHVQVLYFAVLRERLSRDDERLALEGGATVAAALHEIAKLHPELPSLLGRIQTAVNRKIVASSHPLADGDELALIPPVSGGARARRIAVDPRPLSLDAVVSVVSAPEHGGIVTFTGQVRRTGQLRDVERLEYEAYVPMAEEVLTAIADELEFESPGIRVAIHHRTGSLAVGDIAVVIAVGAAHRAEAFAACRLVIERLKQRAPIWKKEVGSDGAIWIGTGP